MKHEYSAGGVVFHKVGEEIFYLMAKHSGYHKWVLPKGMIESGETNEQTALREVREETGIQAKLYRAEPLHIETYEYQADYSENPISVGGVERRVLTYQESGGKQVWVRKTVTFFLMVYVEGEASQHSWEMEEVEWLTYDKALQQLAFAGEREALTKANTILSKEDIHA